MTEYDDEHRVLWAPAIPVFFVVFLLTIFVSIAGLVLGVAALATFVVRVRRRQWTVLTYSCAGAFAGAVVALLFALASHALHS